MTGQTLDMASLVSRSCAAVLDTSQVCQQPFRQDSEKMLHHSEPQLFLCVTVCTPKHGTHPIWNFVMCLCCVQREEVCSGLTVHVSWAGPTGPCTCLQPAAWAFELPSCVFVQPSPWDQHAEGAP